MKINQAIAMADEIKPNAFSNEAKTVWLNEIEGKIQTEVFLWPVDEVIQYVYAGQISRSVSFPDDHSLKMDMDGVTGWRPGAVVTISGLSACPENNVASRIVSVSSQGIAFPEGTFRCTGCAPEVASIHYDGSEAQLLVAAPHSKLYYLYLEAMTDYANGDYDRYANTMTMFNAAWSEFEGWFARVYRPADRV